MWYMEGRKRGPEGKVREFVKGDRGNQKQEMGEKIVGGEQGQ